jgi:6-phosphogluconolactonase (cycloisomerase 2 family)
MLCVARWGSSQPVAFGSEALRSARLSVLDRPAVSAGARRPTLVISLAIAVCATGAVAWASTGALKPKQCIADEGNNPGGCPSTTPGLNDTQFVTVSDDGKSVYAGGYADNAIVRFKRNRDSGALTARGCVGNDGSNPDGCAQTADGLVAPSSIAVSRDGKSVYVASDESNDSAGARFKRNRRTGALTPKGCIADPDTNPDGCATTAQGLNGGTTAVAISRDGKSVYFASGNDDAIVRFRRNTDTGALTPKGCVADTDSAAGCPKTTKGLTNPHAVTVSRDGKSVYATGSQDNAIVRFRRNRDTGALNPRGCIADLTQNPDGCARTARGLDDPAGLAVSEDGKSLYASAGDADAIVRFRRDRRTGALNPKGCIADPDSNSSGCGATVQGLDIPGPPALSADSRSLYVAGLLDNAIVRFKRIRDTGALKPRGCVGDTDNNLAGCGQTTQGLDDVFALAVSGDGKSVYSASIGDNAILRLRRER